MTSKATQTVNVFNYYENKFNRKFTLKVPDNMIIHHYALIVIASIFEVYYNSRFIIPLMVMAFTQFLTIRSLFKSRVISRCIILEMDNQGKISNEEKEDIFKICCDETNDIGFLYTRGALISKSLVLMFLIHYATIGLSI